MKHLLTCTRLALACLLTSPLAACGGGGNPVIPQLRPVEGGWVSSAFGQREDHPVLGHVEDRSHDGYDFAVAEGTPIKATMDGEVEFAGLRGGYGKAVLIAHAGGLTTLYGHARELRASPGDQVKAGDIIAFVGSTGLSTGPHLHYELRKHGVALDPGGFLSDPATPKQTGYVPPTAVMPPAPLRQATASAEVPVWDGEARIHRPAKTGE